MNTSTKQRSTKSVVKSILLFAAHQLVGTWGVAIFAYFLGTSIWSLWDLFAQTHSKRPLHWVLTETPFFPIQICLSTYFGWSLARRFRHREMQWVWVIPTMILCYAIIAIPARPPDSLSALSPVHAAWSDYFGWGCLPQNHCLSQLVITMPFYIAVAYSAPFARPQTSMPTSF